MSNNSTTILIVDDNKDMRKNIVKALEDINYSFLEASNHRQMQDALKNNNVDVVVLDLLLPVTDPIPHILNYAGLEYLKSIKKHDNTIPVIVFSIHSEKSYQEDASKLGAFDYIVKSSDSSKMKLLREKVHEAALLRQTSHVTKKLGGQDDLFLIKTLIVLAFSLNELQDLCMQMKINYDTLAGSSLDSKARELVWYCERHGRIPQLISACTASRPNSPWPQN